MKLDRITLEKECSSKLSREHVCDENKMPNQLLIFHVDEYSGQEQDHFELFTAWISTQEDVASGDARDIGEILNLSSIEVNYCPFCGGKLE